MRRLILFSLIALATQAFATEDTKAKNERDNGSFNYYSNLARERQNADLNRIDGQINGIQARREALLNQIQQLTVKHQSFITSMNQFTSRFTTSTQPIYGTGTGTKIDVQPDSTIDLGQIAARSLLGAVSKATFLKQPPVQGRRSEIWSKAWDYLVRGFKFDHYVAPTQTFAGCQNDGDAASRALTPETVGRCRTSYQDGAMRGYRASFQVPDNFGKDLETPLYGVARCFENVPAPAGATGPALPSPRGRFLNGSQPVNMSEIFRTNFTTASRSVRVNFKCPGGETIQNQDL